MSCHILGRHVSRLSGFAPAVPTPFDENGAVDSPALERFCDRQIHEGATALVVCGTTGEAPTLSRAEHDQIVRIAVNVAQVAYQLSPAPDQTRRARPLNWPKMPRLPVPTPSCQSCRTTTSRSRPACTLTFVRFPIRLVFRSSFTTFRRARFAASPMPRSPVWPKTDNSLGSKTQRATSRDRCD